MDCMLAINVGRLLYTPSTLHYSLSFKSGVWRLLEEIFSLDIRCLGLYIHTWLDFYGLVVCVLNCQPRDRGSNPTRAVLCLEIFVPPASSSQLACDEYTDRTPLSVGISDGKRRL